MVIKTNNHITLNLISEPRRPNSVSEPPKHACVLQPIRDVGSQFATQEFFQCQGTQFSRDIPDQELSANICNAAHQAGIIAQEFNDRPKIITPDLVEQAKEIARSENKPIHVSKTNDGSVFSYHITPNHVYEKIKPTTPPPEGTTKKKKEARIVGTSEVTARIVCTSQEEAKRQRVKDEFGILSQFKGARGIVQVYEMVESENKRGIPNVTIYEKNYNLGDLDKLIWNEPENLQDVYRMTEDLIHGLKAIHDKNYVHRDIKPANILINRRDDGQLEAAIGDFDVCQTITESDGIAGSPLYFSPEKATVCCNLINGMACTWSTKDEQKADIWTLGQVLYFLHFDPIRTSAKLPKWFSDQPNPLSTIQSYHNKEGAFFKKPENKNSIEHLIWTMLQSKPENRPTMDQVLAQWEKMTSSKVLPPSPTTAPPALFTGLDLPLSEELDLPPPYIEV